jgi:subtilisin family serine protease
VVGTVPLVTGGRVTVIEGPNGTRSYRVHADGRSVHLLHTDRGTYVVPAGVDFDRFDPELFNVDRLVRRRAVAGGETVPAVVRFRPGPTGVATAGTVATQRQRLVAAAAGTGLDATATLESAAAVAGDLPADNGTYRRLATDPTVADVTLDPLVTTSSRLDGRLGRTSRADRSRIGRATADRIGTDTAGSRTATHRLRDRRPLATETSRDLAGAARARAASNLTGRNVTVAVLDTGIDETHPDLAGREAAERDFTVENTTADLDGHGTHVAGIVAGDGTASGGRYVGVAPDATLLDARVLGAFGGGRLSGVIDGLEWADARGADVASMSLGAPTASPRAGDLLATAVADVSANGTLVVAAAGNAGPTGLTIDTPGIAADALTVGATNASGRGVAGFSSRGPTPGLFLKPDLLAPGTDVASAASRHPYPDRAYVNLTGTSMATPAVSGAAALVLAADPDATPAAVRSRLGSTTDPLAAGSPYDAGTGRLNVTAALDAGVTVAPSTVDFGGYANATRATRTVRLYNRGDADRTVALNATAALVGGDAAGTVSVNESRVTLPARESTAVELAVDTGGPAGPYAGRLVVRPANATGNGTGTQTDERRQLATAAFGWVRVHRLTVEKRALGNGSTDGDLVVLDRRRRDGFGRPVVATLGDPLYAIDGQVTVLSAGVDETTDGANASVLTVGSATVDGPTTVRLNESATVTHGVNLSPVGDPTVVGSEATVSGPGGRTAYTLARPGRHPLRVTPGRTVDAGLELLAVDADDATASRAPLDTPTAYLLEFGSTGVAGPREYTPDPSRLTAIDATYHRAAAGQSLSLVPVAVGPPGFGDVAVGYGLGDRRRQVVHTRPNGRYRLGVSGGGGGAGWELSGRQLRLSPGAATTVDLNRYPLQPRLPTWTISDRGVSYVAQFRTDRAGNLLTAVGQRRYTLLRNGTRETNASWPFAAAFAFGLDVRPGTTIEVRTRSSAPVGPLSNRARAAYRATYRPGRDSRPPVLGPLDVRTLGPNATVTDATAVVYVTVSDASRTRVSATATDGTTTVDARTFPAGGSRVGVAVDARRLDGPVDVNLTVVDALGNRVAVRIDGAFRVDTRTPFETALAQRGAADLAPPLDLDGDGLYADVNGDGRVTFVDVVTLAYADVDAVTASPARRDALDFDGDGDFDFQDALALLDRIRAR